MRLTDDEREKIANGTVARLDGALIRSVETWREILPPDMPPLDAAARILGDITCFTSDRGMHRRPAALADAIQLSNVLQAVRPPDAERLRVVLEDVGAALLVVLDCVDFTNGACGPAELVGAVLPHEVIANARQAIARAAPLI